MTFNQINYFLAFADTLNFTHAAAGLFVTQSTLSRSISTLESELGFELLDKSNPHAILLTPAGELFRDEMRPVMDKTNEIITRIREADERHKKSLKVGILEGQEIDRCILFAIKDMADSYPEFSIEIRKSSFSEMYSKLRSKELDMMLTTLSGDDEIPEECDSFFIKHLPCYLVAKKEDPIWESEISLHALNGKNIVLSSEYYPGKMDILRKIEEAGIDVSFMDATDTETQRVILEAGVGVTITNSGSVFVSRTGRQLLRTAPMEDFSAVSLELQWHKGIAPAIVSHFVKLVDHTNREISQMHLDP